MKHFLLILLLLFSLGSTAQSSLAESRSVSSVINKPVSTTDSFTFCSTRFKVPREDCSAKTEINCCSATSVDNRGSLACNNGTTLFWTYFDNEPDRHNFFRNLTTNSQKEQTRRLSKKPVTCLLLGKELEGYLVKYKFFNGAELQSIIVEDMVNGYNVVVELHLAAFRKPNKQKLSDGIQQILQVSK